MTDIDDIDEGIDDGYAREEPDCFGCMDGRRVSAWWGRGSRRCPDCDPSWWSHQRHMWRHRGRELRERFFPPRRPAAGLFDDEAPF